MNIRINNLCVEFRNGTKALDGVNLEIHHGIFGLLGENGAGKTTLMRTLTTLLPASSGEIYFNDMKLISENYAIIQKKIGYLPQELNLYPQLKMREVLEYMGQISGLSKEECKKNIDDYLDKTHLVEQQKKRMSQLSGGMKRRVGLIQAMITNPEILIVDEPTTGLDPEERIRIRNLLVDFSKEKTVIFSTHVIEDIASTCKKLAVMRTGKVIYQGEVSDMIAMAKNHIRVMTVSSDEEAAALDEKYIVCEKQYGLNGIDLKIISPQEPFGDRSDERISLEDAYVYLMNCDRR
ncbi:MAG: ATP-binding cassette domain-containing protein [Lachnospiraceae bacterium]|nr:ATP-binding cassette domain-containing protein [Lachnospiraceae bacterium]